MRDNTREMEMFLYGTKLTRSNGEYFLQGIPVKVYLTNEKYHIHTDINFPEPAIFRETDDDEWCYFIYEFYIDDYGNVFTSAINHGRNRYPDEKVGYVKQEDVIKANREILRREYAAAVGDENYERARLLNLLKYFSKTGQEWDEMARK